MRRSFFDLSHEHKLSMDMGQLVPVCAEEVLPGDTFIGSTSALARVAPLAHPVMHNVDLHVHHWYVPNRILWDGWEDFITGDDTQVHPVKTLDSDVALADHFGMYPQTGLEVNELPFRAYNSIYNHNYRDQDLQSERAEDADTIARVCWDKDYFTTARAQPQQGDSVEIGFSAGQAPVMGIGIEESETAGSAGSFDYVQADGSYLDTNVLGDGDWSSTELVFQGGPGAVSPSNPPLIYADLAGMEGGISIDDLRRSVALQRFAEARMRFGSRYEDYLRFLGINPRDGRLSRPEYLGGGRQNIAFSEVITTAEGSTTNPGDLYGHGLGAMRSRRYRKMFEEHGWVISLMYARPKTAYLQHMPRKFMRTDPMDYWQKELETLPWQQVKHKEIYAPDDNDTVFGYVPRFEEYRHSVNYASGSFRTTDKDWHLARDLSSEPSLNASFVECTPDDRIYSDTSMPELQISAWNSIKAKRLVCRSAKLGAI